MLTHERYEEDDKSRMEFIAYFAIIILVVTVMVIAFLLTRSVIYG